MQNKGIIVVILSLFALLVVAGGMYGIKRNLAGDTLVKGKKKYYRLGSAFSFL